MRAPAPVPGRLRLRFTQLKQRNEQLDSVAASLQAVNGVLALETSALIGGLLIHFDAAIGKTPAFWDHIESVLQSYHLMLNPRPLAQQSGDAGGADNGRGGRKNSQIGQSNPEPEPLARRHQTGNAPEAAPPGALLNETPACNGDHGHASETARHPAPGGQSRETGAATGPHPPTSKTAPGRVPFSPIHRASFPLQAGGADASGVGRRLAGDIASALVDKLIERAAIALFAVLL